VFLLIAILLCLSTSPPTHVYSKYSFLVGVVSLFLELRKYFKVTIKDELLRVVNNPEHKNIRKKENV